MGKNQLNIQKVMKSNNYSPNELAFNNNKKKTIFLKNS